MIESLRSRIRGFLALGLFALVASPAAAQTMPPSPALARHPEVAAALRVLDAWIEATVAQREQPGLSIGIVYDQDLIWAKGYGFADLESRRPATPATLYRVASITKLFTATAVMQLRDAGRLRLDDPVRDRLPWFTVQKAGDMDPPITIRQLLTHTSGLPRDFRAVNWNYATFPGQGVLQAEVSDLKAVLSPATRWKYSNLAYAVAGAVIEQASGETWSGYIEQHLLKPLGMTATSTAPRRNHPDLATGYARRVPGVRREPEPFVEIGDVAAAGVLASNVEDLSRFVALQFRTSSDDSGAVVRGSTLREMHRVQWLNPDWQGGWGLGFKVRRVAGHDRVGHPGGLPGQVTNLEVDPILKLGVIVLTNANDGDALRYVDQAFNLVRPAVTQVTAPPPTRREVPAHWAAFEGTYESPRCETCAYKFYEMRIQILNGELTMITPDDEDPWGSRLVLTPVDAHTFTLESPDQTYAEVAERLTFELDGAGKVQRVKRQNQTWLPKADTRSGPIAR